MPKIVSLEPLLEAAAGLLVPNAPPRLDVLAAAEATPQLLESLGFSHQQLPARGLQRYEIGSGAWARAYLTPSGKVLKLTMDASDAMVSSVLASEGHVPGLVGVEAVYRMPMKVRERRSSPEPNAELYAIVVERAYPLQRIWPPEYAMHVAFRREKLALVPGLPSGVDPEHVDELKVALDALAAGTSDRTGMQRHLPPRPMTETLAKAMKHGDRIGINALGMQYLHDLVQGWSWMADHGYRMGDLHTGNAGLTMDGRAVLLDLGMSADQAASEEAASQVSLAANPSGRLTLTELSSPAVVDIEQDEQGIVVSLDDHGIPLRFRIPSDRPKTPTPEDEWKRPHPYRSGEFMGEYYTWDPSLGPGEMLKRWKEYGAKAYDGIRESMELPTGERFQAFVPADILWRHREDDRPYHGHLARSMQEHGWLSPVLLQIGQNGCLKIGEGNHRLRVAKERRAEYVPVRLWFMRHVDCPTSKSRRERREGYERIVTPELKAEEREADVRHYTEERGLKFNPSDKVDSIFDESFDELEERFPDFGTIELYEDERAGADNGAGSERQFAYCKDGNPIQVAFAPKAAELPAAQLRGLMRHELGHALEYRYGVAELEKRLGRRLPGKIERRADAIAEAVWGEPIVYDEILVQCVGVAGTRPRPAHLPDEKAVLKPNVGTPPLREGDTLRVMRKSIYAHRAPPAEKVTRKRVASVRWPSVRLRESTQSFKAVVGRDGSIELMSFGARPVKYLVLDVER